MVNDKRCINFITQTTVLAMNITLQYIRQGDTVIDATAGNGGDTVVLAEAVGPRGHVIAFDIQKDALNNTQKLLEEKNLLKRVRLIQDTHENMGIFIEPDQEITAIVFNLGYLPSGDKSITTKSQSTVNALKSASKVIKIGGIITLVLYSGHEEGQKEKTLLLEMLKDLPSKEFHVGYTAMLNQINHPPEIVWITKKR